MSSNLIQNSMLHMVWVRLEQSSRDPNISYVILGMHGKTETFWMLFCIMWTRKVCHEWVKQLHPQLKV